MSTENLGDTIAPKSDQLNADDLLTGPQTFTIAGVRRGDKDQPVSIDIPGRMPFKPCKSMRRVLIAAWGENGSDWIGRTMTLYCDPSVMFGGVRMGGIRISHLSHLQNDVMSINLTTTRGRRAEYRVSRIAAEPYPQEAFDANLSAWREAIAAGRLTADKLIKKAESTTPMTEDQKKTLREPV